MSGTLDVEAIFTVEADSAAHAVAIVDANSDLVSGWRPAEREFMGDCTVSAIPVDSEHVDAGPLGKQRAPEAFSVAGAAKYTGYGRQGIYKMLKEKRLAFISVGGKPFIRKEDLDEVMFRRGGKPPTKFGKRKSQQEPPA